MSLGTATLFHLLLIVQTVISGLFENDVQEQCNTNCATDLIFLNQGGTDVFCDHSCSTQHCQKGCSVHQNATHTSCLKVCTAVYRESGNITGYHSPGHDQIKYCLQGCNFALEEYWNNVNVKLGYLKPPSLLTLSYSSLTLRWDTIFLEDVIYKLHKQIVAEDTGWSLHEDTKFRQNGRIEVENLQPNITYKFKVLILVTSLPEHLLESPETIEMTTEAHGALSAAPQITSVVFPSIQAIYITWTPPPFSHGMILSYSIYVQAVSHSRLNRTITDIPWNVTSWLVSQLQPSQQYVISISAWNSQGEGPRNSRTISTPNPDNASAQETPYLIFGTANKIVRRSLYHVLNSAHLGIQDIIEGDAEYLLQVGDVADISLHVRRQLILASDGSGSVTLISLADKSTTYNVYPDIKNAGAISVDWLADRVYIASTDRIYSCPLDKGPCVAVLQGLPGTVNNIRVDPINGYLFYVIHGIGHGLYRIALGTIANIWTSPALSLPLLPPSPQMIVSLNDLLTHVIDFNNILLYVANNTARMMVTTFLDGNNMQPVQGKIFTSAFNQVSSMVIYNQTFIWTDKTKMYVEAYVSHSQNYQHSELLFFKPPYTGLNVFHSSAQPLPIPFSAPASIEAVLTRNSAAIKWMPPPLLQYQGWGAWTNWTYELQLSKSKGSDGLLSELQNYNISGLSLTVTNLDPDSVYRINIRARSEEGYGPWSRDFIGRTLKQDGLHVLMGLAGGQIVDKDLDQGTETNVVSLHSDILDMDWHEDIILLVTEPGSLSVYDRMTQETQELITYGAYCIAYDWLGHKVYWSEPVLGVIHRSDISGNSHDSICQTKARDLAIDAVSGRLYWATQFSIETSYLNGDEHQEIFTLPFFTDRHIISLTIDLDNGKLLWFEKGYNFQAVFMVDTVPLRNVGLLPTSQVIVGEFKSISSSSGLQYFSHHLFWLTEQNSLVIGDSQCNYSSSMSFYSNLTSFTVAHPSMHSYPATVSVDKVRVIPNPIQPEDIHIEGVWSNFNLTWPKSTGVTHGTVFFRVLVDVPNYSDNVVTSQHFFEMSGLPPYTQLVVSIQSYTYWGYADTTTVSVRTPMSTPTAPLSPDIYVIHHKNATASHQSLAADFRWMTPQITNGIISHHIMTYWTGNGSQTIVQLKGTSRHFILTPLVKSQTYHFKIAACTEAGCGPESPTKTVVANDVNPVSTLLVAFQQSLSLTQVDSEINSTVILTNITPKAVTFLGRSEPKIFWLDMENKVYESKESFFQEVVALNGTGQDFTIDWISRTMYIVESTSSGESNIMQFNLDMADYRMLLSRPAHIGSILADPYNSTIIWTEWTSEGEGRVMKADVTTGEVEVVLGNKSSYSEHNSDKKPCSCSQTLNVAPVIAVGYKDYDGSTEIVFADKITGAIYSSNVFGCQCTRIIQPTPSQRFGLPPNLLAVDHMRVSWYNKTEGKLYSISKTSSEEVVVHDVNDVVDILAYGSHLQPLPDSECLDPGAYNSSVEFVQIGNTSVSMRLVAPDRPPACQGISASQYKYTVYYRKITVVKTGTTPEDCQADLSMCDKQHFYTTNVELKNLEPYTQYLIQVAVSGYYTEYLSEALSKPQMLTTRFGVPEPARIVSAKPLTPELILVKWQPPVKLNGPREEISYVVQYSTVTTKGLVQKEMEKSFDDEITKDLEIDLKDLKPDHIYSVQILTCVFNKTLCSVTDTVQCKTFRPPSNITLVNVTAHSLEIQWNPPPEKEIIRHQTTYAEVGPSPLNWSEVNLVSFTNNMEIREAVTALRPNTLYAFRLRLAYNARPFDRAIYIWPPEETLFTHRTLVFHPDQPSPPTVVHLKSGSYEVRWEAPCNNGAAITNYILEYSSVEDGIWKTAYNGSLEHWLIDTSRMNHGMSHVFRVAAVNSEGMGSFSDNSPLFLAPLAMETSFSNHITIGVVLGIIALLAVIILAVVYVLHKRCQEGKTQKFILRGPDTELATLRELPHTTFQQSNTLYAINIQCTDEEIAKLPHFSRNQLVLTIFLGSGAFGEVFEGLAKNIRGDSTGETRCAVKTLRKSASDNEKEEFLKEALLMKNFQHEHILSLLGVCLDNDPQFIIMELMEGGDLLSFLRCCRATSSTPVKLLLPDLVKICLHVARGCKYMEDMHFVHRDLAARNCLVSTKSPADMIVKIGDFGLARDIYKNDYYRKEGEGLLPVRWMSPESLVDGFFTTQSDIWAFGVLMWEVVTLGQQPYPARTNIEVLHFVRDRGKLERPDKCADELYSLMSKCWNFHAANRPCFASLVENLEIFQEKCKQMTAEEISQYSTSYIDGGGSVRLTQSGKEKRLSDLLGSSDTPEKLVVDLTKMSRKRTHSLEDSKNSSQTKPSDVIANDHFPAAGDYDHNGYLEPRGTKNGGRYLELKNYAPELLHLCDPFGNPLFSGNGSAFLPVHVTHKGYHPSNVSYTLLSPEEDAEDARYHMSTGNSSGSDVCGMEDPRLYTQLPAGQSYGFVSVEKSPVCSQVQDDHLQYSPRTPGRLFGDYHHQTSLSPTTARLIKPLPQRKFSDQDLYASTAQYRERHPASSNSCKDHRYASLECNNNRSSTSNGNLSSGQVNIGDRDSNGFIRNRHNSDVSFRRHVKPGLSHPLSVNLPVTVGDESSKLSSDCSAQRGSDIVNYQGHGHHNSRSRGQVYPENSATLVGYETNQVSLL